MENKSEPMTIQDFYTVLKAEEDKISAEIKWHRNHKFNHEADHLETKRRVIREVCYNLNAVLISKHQETPKFDFE